MASKARVLLVGSGGIGTIAAFNLEHGNLAQVSCVLRSNYAAVMQRGFEITSSDHGHIQSWRPTEILNAVPHFRGNGDRPFDYIVICTKNVPDVGPSLCQIIGPAVTSRHTVITLIQNGLNIERPFLLSFPDNIILSGVSRIDAHEVSPGVIEQKQKDNLHIGAFHNPKLDSDKQRRAAEEFVKIYRAGGNTTCLHEPDVARDRWSKLVYNATWNPICALTGVNTGDLRLTNCVIDDLLYPAMKEVLKVSQARGCLLPMSIIDETIHCDPVEEKVTPSMQKDLEKGNFIEHENILGEVIREARAAGVATPILSAIYALCSGIQWKTKKAKGLVDLAKNSDAI
ncbi:hypothetical protein N7537_003995 [Penicillium hordei]|uniref:2-dehydropantoate 2-reductase n=1 Tax=Penicillium hordei TaxID=40994 RepID=A0AAD6H4I6_9EURO|nr:uncharacterized protein N7537_003995 [Penicillium hordei]KAJ5607376.1 hypothetical protein N7537_003995 [Penicillium hordei]